MTPILRIILIAASVCTMGYMLRKIRQSKVKIEYSIYWIVFSCILIIFSVFPQIPSTLSKILGIQTPVNFIYLFIIFILLIKLFYNSLLLSKLEEKITNLSQRVAVEEALEKESGKKDTARDNKEYKEPKQEDVVK